MEEKYLNKAKYSFLVLMMVGFILMPFSLGLGGFIAFLGLIFTAKFFNWSARKPVYLTNDDKRVIPKLKEISKVELVNEAGSKNVVSEKDLRKLKQQFKRIKAINSTSLIKRKFKVIITDSYEGLWELDLVVTDEDTFEFISKGTYFGGSSMKEVGAILGVKAC